MPMRLYEQEEATPTQKASGNAGYAHRLRQGSLRLATLVKAANISGISLSHAYNIPLSQSCKEL